METTSVKMESAFGRALPLPEVIPPRLSYPCTHCNKVFKFAVHYRRHMIRVRRLID